MHISIRVKTIIMQITIEKSSTIKCMVTNVQWVPEQ